MFHFHMKMLMSTTIRNSRISLWSAQLKESCVDRVEGCRGNREKKDDFFGDMMMRS